MTTARRSAVTVTWGGDGAPTSIDRYTTELTYTDRLHSEADDLTIRLLDRDLREDADSGAADLYWSGDAGISQGDEIRAWIDVSNWRSEGDNRELDCGRMVVDEVVYTCPPAVVEIRATSVKPNEGAARTRKTRAWEATDLRTIAGDVASDAGWRLVYDLTGAPEYDRLDQVAETDLDLLRRLAGQLGGVVKVWDGQLVISDEASLESRPPIISITVGVDWVKGWRYRAQSHTRYGSARCSYWDAWRRRLVTHTEGSGPPVLDVRERAQSKAEAISKAKGALSQANRDADQDSTSLALVGNPDLTAGSTVSVVSGTGLDGIYLVTQAVHRVGAGGYTTDLTLRRREV